MNDFLKYAIDFINNALYLFSYSTYSTCIRLCKTNEILNKTLVVILKN